MSKVEQHILPLEVSVLHIAVRQQEPVVLVEAAAVVPAQAVLVEPMGVLVATPYIMVVRGKAQLPNPILQVQPLDMLVVAAVVAEPRMGEQAEQPVEATGGNWGLHKGMPEQMGLVAAVAAVALVIILVGMVERVPLSFSGA